MKHFLVLFLETIFMYLLPEDKNVFKYYSLPSVALSCKTVSLFVSDCVCVRIYNKETDVLLAEAQSQWNMPSLGRYISLSISLMSAFQ